MFHKIGVVFVLMSAMFVGGSPLVPVIMVAIGAGFMWLGRRTA